RFTGTIHSTERQPYAPRLVPRDRIGGARLRLKLAANTVGRSFPLVTTGSAGRGDVLFLRVAEGGRVTFGYDHCGAPAEFSRELQLGTETEHAIEFRMPALSSDDGNGELILIVDGAVIWKK